MKKCFLNTLLFPFGGGKENYFTNKNQEVILTNFIFNGIGLSSFIFIWTRRAGKYDIKQWESSDNVHWWFSVADYYLNRLLSAKPRCCTNWLDPINYSDNTENVGLFTLDLHPLDMQVCNLTMGLWHALEHSHHNSQML